MKGIVNLSHQRQNVAKRVCREPIFCCRRNVAKRVVSQSSAAGECSKTSAQKRDASKMLMHPLVYFDNKKTSLTEGQFIILHLP